MRTIAAGHYNRRRDEVKIASEIHEDAGANKREVLEQLVALVHEALRLCEKHGPYSKPRVFPPYEH